MRLELISTQSAQWPLNGDGSIDGIVTLNGVRKVQVEVSDALYRRLCGVRHFWVFSKRSSGSDRAFYDAIFSHFPNPTAEDLETFVQRLEIEMVGYDKAKRVAEAEARARSEKELEGIRPWVRSQRR